MIEREIQNREIVRGKRGNSGEWKERVSERERERKGAREGGETDRQRER